MNLRRALLTVASTLVATGVLAGAALAAHVRRHRPLLTQVAPDLRTPALAAPLSVGGPVTLGLVRRLLANEPVVRPGVGVHEVRVGEVRVLVYRPPNRTEPTAGLLWLHGGGFVMGRPEGDHPQSSWLAAELGVVVVSVDYRLAPEHPFPAGLDDAHVALVWMHAHAEELGVDPDRIAVGGASAGAGLAATLVQRAHDEARVPVAFQLLLYPMLDDRTTGRPVSQRPHLVWTPRSNRYGWASYLGGSPGSSEPAPYAAASRRLDLVGLPPAWIGVGDVDLFHDESLDYAQRLTAAGVDCTVHVEPGMYHGADASFADTVETTRRFRRHLLDAARAGFTDPR